MNLWKSEIKLFQDELNDIFWNKNFNTDFLDNLLSKYFKDKIVHTNISCDKTNKVRLLIYIDNEELGELYTSGHDIKSISHNPEFDNMMIHFGYVHPQVSWITIFDHFNDIIREIKEYKMGQPYLLSLMKTYFPYYESFHGIDIIDNNDVCLYVHFKDKQNYIKLYKYFNDIIVCSNDKVKEVMSFFNNNYFILEKQYDETTNI